MRLPGIGEPVIRGLSLTRPWPFAFVNGPERLQKRVENRSWKPPKHMIGSVIALHAAQSWDEGAREIISEILGVPVPPKAEHPHGRIFATAWLRGYVTEEGQLPALQQSWFFGPVGWWLGELVALDSPVPCTGALSLWKLPAEVEAEVRRQMKTKR